MLEVIFLPGRGSFYVKMLYNLVSFRFLHMETGTGNVTMQVPNTCA